MLLLLLLLFCVCMCMSLCMCVGLSNVEIGLLVGMTYVLDDMEVMYG